jgi:D-glycero-D-manno-heptose 1,7-bisphosphate phosphatase
VPGEFRPAVFVDRDGTVIREREYLSDPAGVELLPGAVEGLLAFRDAGYRVVIVTNQSGIARGLYGEPEYQDVRREVERQLTAAGVTVDATYHCPHHPDFTGPCDCRKPATGLFLRASAEHDLDPARSVFVGDRLRDVMPGVELGGRAVLVRTGYGEGEAGDAPPGVVVATDLAEAAARVGREDPPRELR